MSETTDAPCQPSAVASAVSTTEDSAFVELLDASQDQLDASVASLRAALPTKEALLHEVMRRFALTEQLRATA